MLLLVLMAAHGDPADPRPSLPYTRTIPAAKCPPALLQDTADRSLADVAPVTYRDLADRFPADFAPTMLRNSADPSPAHGFNRQCLTGSAPLPVWFNCLVINTWVVEYLVGSTRITVSLIEPRGIDHRQPSDWCVCTCLICWGSIGTPRRGPARVLRGWCLWLVAPSNPCTDVDRWTRDLWLA